MRNCISKHDTANNPKTLNANLVGMSNEGLSLYSRVSKSSTSDSDGAGLLEDVDDPEYIKRYIQSRLKNVLTDRSFFNIMDREEDGEEDGEEDAEVKERSQDGEIVRLDNRSQGYQNGDIYRRSMKVDYPVLYEDRSSVMCENPRSACLDMCPPESVGGNSYGDITYGAKPSSASKTPHTHHPIHLNDSGDSKGGIDELQEHNSYNAYGKELEYYNDIDLNDFTSSRKIDMDPSRPLYEIRSNSDQDNHNKTTLKRYEESLKVSPALPRLKHKSKLKPSHQYLCCSGVGDGDGNEVALLGEDRRDVHGSALVKVPLNGGPPNVAEKWMFMKDKANKKYRYKHEEDVYYLNKYGHVIPLNIGIPSKPTKLPYVVLTLHGSDTLAHQRQDYLPDKLGVPVVSMEYPGYGVTRRRIRNCTMALIHKWAEATYLWMVEDLNIPSHRICINGYSIGSGAAMQLAADAKAMSLPPGFLYLESAYVSLKRIALDFTKKIPAFQGMFRSFVNWAIPETFDYSNAIAQVDPLETEIVLMHGGADWLISPRQSTDLARKIHKKGAGKNATIYLFGDLNHFNLEDASVTKMAEHLDRAYENETKTRGSFMKESHSIQRDLERKLSKQKMRNDKLRYYYRQANRVSKPQAKPKISSK